MKSPISILISKKHFWSMGRKFLCEDQYSFLPMIEKYLDNQGIKFSYFGESLKVFPIDRYQTHEICAYFGLRDIDFFDGENVIMLFPSKGLDRRRVFSRLSREDYFGMPLSFSFKKNTKKSSNETNPVTERFTGVFLDSNDTMRLFETGMNAVQGRLL